MIVAGTVFSRRIPITRGDDQVRSAQCACSPRRQSATCASHSSPAEPEVSEDEGHRVGLARRGSGDRVAIIDTIVPGHLPTEESAAS